MFYFFIPFAREYDVCKLTDRYRKRICAEVARVCNSELEKIEVDIIRDEITDVGVCYKQKFRVQMDNGETWRGKKKMYRCEAFTVAGVEIKRFYVSNGGKPGTTIIFDLDEKLKKYVKVFALITGLNLDP